jgi:hypothetical protein
MKKRTFLAFAMLFALLSSALQAQTDVTATYLTNPDFETAPIAFPTADGIANPEATRYATSGYGSRIYVPTGWDLVIPANTGGNAQYAYLATGLFGVDYTTVPEPLNGVEFPTSDRTGAFLALTGAWSAAPRLAQNVTLPAGQYTLQYDAYDKNNGKTLVNYFGFVPDDGTAIYGAETAFTTSWATYSVSFTLTEVTAGKISIGITGTNTGATSSANLAVDNIKLFFTDLNTGLNLTLTSLIATATALKDSTAVPDTFDKTAIETAIANATAALASNDVDDKFNAIDELNTAISDIQTAIANARAVNMADIVSGQKYNLRHVATGMYLQFLDKSDGDFCINAMPSGSNANFDFIFTAVAGAADTYMLGINNGTNSGYMSGDSWNIQLGDPATASQKQIILLDQSNNEIRLRAGWRTSNVINFDCINAACQIFADKSGSANANFIIELSPNAFDMVALITAARTALQEAITEAQTLSNNTVNGSLPGQYTGKAAFTAAIAAANAVYDNAASTLTELQDATAALLLAIETYKATRINPYTGYAFKLKQVSSGLYVSKIVPSESSSAAVLKENGSIDYEQIFEFEELSGVTNGVRLKTADGYYLYYSSYNSRWTTTPSTSADLKVEEDASGEFIRLKFINYNYFSSDAITDGASIFCDKASNASNGRWIMEIQDPRVILGQVIVNAATKLALAVVGTGIGEYPQTAVDSLTNAIATAQAVYDNPAATDEEIQAAQTSLQNTLDWFINIPVARATLYALIDMANATLGAATAGTAIGNHPQAAIDALTTTIAAAQAVCINAASTDEQINAQKTTLQTALDLFISQEISFSTGYLNQNYNIIHSSGNLLSKVSYTDNEGNPIVNAVINALNTPNALQTFEFESVTGIVDVVALKSSDGKYLSYNSWNTPWIDSINANVHIKISATADGYLNLKMVGKNLLGTDNNNDSTNVYADKSGDNLLYKWMVQTPGSTIKIKLRAIIVQSDTLLNHISTGSEMYQFPTADYNAFVTVLNASKMVLANEAATQAEVDAQVATLNAALNTLYGKQIIPQFSPVSGKKYIITNKQRAGYVKSNGTRAVVEVTPPVEGWEFTKVRDSVFVFKSGNLAMAQSLNMVAYSADAPDRQWYVHYDGPKAYNVYVRDANDTKLYFSFSSNAAFSNALQQTANGLQITAEHSHTDQSQWFAITEVGAPLTEGLESLIATVESALASAVVGTAYGNYPQAAKDSLQSALNLAQDVLAAASGLTQLQINEATDALQASLTWFGNQKIVWRPAEEMAYYIGNRDNANYLSIDTLSASVATGYKMDSIPLINQLWFFEPVLNKAGFYHIVSDKHAIGNSGGTSIFVEEYDPATAKEIEVRYQATANGIEYFLLVTTNTYPNIQIGSDGNVSSDRYTYNNYQIKLVAAGALRTEIYKAQILLNSVTIGNGLTEYPQSAANTLQAVIDASLVIAQDGNDENDAAQVQPLKEAEAAFLAAQYGYGLDLSALEAALAEAAELEDNTTEIGSEAGKCPQNVIDALLAAVATAKNAEGMQNVQAAIDSKVTELNTAIAIFKTALKASTGLTALLAEADAQHDAAVEGVLPGQYQAGAKAAFKEAIDAAQVVFDAEPVVQANLIAAYNALLNAQDVFAGKINAPLYTADLEDAIAEAEAFLTGKDESKYTELRALLAQAKALLAAPTTQEAIDALTDALYDALETAQTGIEQLFTDVKVFASNGALHISGLTVPAQVRIFNTLGQRILSAKVTGSDFVQPIAKGLYIVTVNSIHVKVFVK